MCVLFICYYFVGEEGLLFSEMGVRAQYFDSSIFLVAGSKKSDIGGPQSLFTSPSVAWYIGNLTVHTAIIYAF